jgi:ATP-dependent metalloprotease
LQEFAKWREIVNQQQQLDQNNSGSPVRFYTTPLQQQQHRTFFFGSTKNSVTKYLRDLELKSLSAVSSQDPSDTQAHYRFLSELAKDYPQLVLQAVQSKQYALSPPIVTLYLRVLMQLQLYNQLDVDSLVSRLQANAADSEGLSPAALQEFARDLHAQKLSKKEQAQHALNFFSAAAAPAAHYGGSGIGGQAMGVLGSLGKNARQPIYVQLADKSSFRQQIVGGVLRFGLFVAVLSAVGAFVDEKGIGRGLGMNASKHIKEAEHDGRKVKFEDVKGVEEAKAELEEIVMYLKDPSKFTRLGGQLPRGLLLTGPPGTGKTLLAKAIAGEADVPFFYSSGSQFEEVYVGLGAKRIRELFEAAKKKAPAIIFIDEIDAVGGTRKLKDQSALKMTLNELLVQLDGFDENQGIIVIGATNFMESLDTALLRPGRFDKHVSVPLPDVGGRKEILEMYAKKTKLSTDVDLNVIARGTPGFSGADLFNLMNQASIKASIDGLEAIDMSSLEYSKDKIIMGPERKTAVITPQTAKSTAYHEAGYVASAYYL